MTLSTQLKFHAERSREAGNHATAIFCQEAAIEVETLRRFIDDAFEVYPSLDFDVDRLRELKTLKEKP
jgi:hypothetical protein